MQKTIFTICILVASFSSVFAQEWHTNAEAAKELATAENKNIVLVFQGSDWCAPCMKLEKEIWSNQKFQELAKEQFIFLKADFPKRKKNKLSEALEKQNSKLAEKYNPNGFFPLVVVLNPEGKLLGTLGYENASPETYFKKLMTFEN